MFDTPEAIAGTVLTVLCLFVFALAGLRLIGVVRTMGRLGGRVSQMGSEELIAKLARAPKDFERLANVAAAFSGLQRRAIVAGLSLAMSLAEIRAKFGMVREAFRHIAG